MITIFSVRRLMSACPLLLLAACSAEPSASEISSAINKALMAEQQQVTQMASSMTGVNPMSNWKPTQVSELEKVGCKDQGQSAYLCDVRYKISGGVMGQMRTPMVVALRMVRSDGEWLVATR